MLTTRKKNPFSLFFIMLLVVVIAASSGFAFFYYSVYSRASKNEVITARAAELKSSEQYLVNLFDALTRQMNGILYTKEIYTWDEASDYPEYHAIMDVLRESKAKHSAIHSIYAVFQEEKLVLTSNEGYFSIDSFYDDVWTQYGTSTMEKLEGTDKIEISEAHILIPHSLNNETVVSLVCGVKLGSSWEQEGEGAYLVVNISLDKIVNVMNAEAWEDQQGVQEVAILSKDGSVVYDGTGGALGYFLNEDLGKLEQNQAEYLDKTVGNTLWLCQAEYFSDTGWYLLRVSPMAGGYASVTLAKNTMLLAVGICLLAIFVVLALIWKRVYRPYSRVMERVRRGDVPSGGGESVEYLEELIGRTLDTKELLMESWFERTFLGGGQDGAPEHDVILLSEFCVLLISTNRGEGAKLGHAIASMQLNGLKTCVKQYMLEKQTELPIKECYCIGMADQRLAVLLETRERVVERKLDPCLQFLFPYVSAHRNLEISIGVSAPHLGVGEMHGAYLEARDALSFSYFYPERNVFYFEKAALLKRDFYIENSVKVDIFTNNLYGMRIEEAKDALGLIVADLKKELEQVIYYNLPNFFSRLFERIYRAVRNMGLEPEQFFELETPGEGQMFNTWEFDSMEEAVKQLYWMLDRIQNYQEEQGNAAKKGSKQWARIMLEYVEANYNKGISLASMAGDLGLDESYLSKQFKEKVGVSFIQYVTKCRMDKAKEMLRDPSVKLAEIAETVGMGNVQSFIRIFKKYEGMTPGQYRETL